MPLPTPDLTPRRIVCPVDRLCADCGMREDAHGTANGAHTFRCREDAPAFWLRPQPVKVATRRELSFLFLDRDRQLSARQKAEELQRLNDDTFLAVFDRAENLDALGDRIVDGGAVLARLQALTDHDRVSTLCALADSLEALDAAGKALSVSPSSGGSLPAPPSTPGSATPSTVSAGASVDGTTDRT